MRKFKVIVLLDGNYEAKFKVKAQTPDEAMTKAEDIAFNHFRHDHEEFEAIEVKELTTA
jgi:hypothetical protein